MPVRLALTVYKYFIIFIFTYNLINKLFKTTKRIIYHMKQ